MSLRFSHALGLLAALTGSWGVTSPAWADVVLAPSASEGGANPTVAVPPLWADGLAEGSSYSSSFGSESGNGASVASQGSSDWPALTEAITALRSQTAALGEDSQPEDWQTGTINLANRRENSDLFESDPGQHQTPLTPPPAQPLPVGTSEEEPDYQLVLRPQREVQIPANGRSSLVLEGDILDPEGNPLERDVVVTLTSSAGEFIGADHDTDRSGFQVLARQGRFEARLRSTLEAQVVTVQATAEGRAVRGLEDTQTRERYPQLLADLQVHFLTDLRPTLISGVVDVRVGRGGTNLLSSFRDFLNPVNLNNDVEFDLNAGIFGTGSLGEWTFTGAYNNQRGLNDRCDGGGLYRDVQACDQRYPTYGDSSTTAFLTPSTDSLYLRFQRDSLAPDANPDYFMWGDFGTQEFAAPSQSFTATVREFHGLKGNFTFGNGIQLTALYGDNVRPFQRDTIAPDGTSGFYFLSRRLILRGSENVFLETEELNRPGTVISRQPLFRGVDYEIDYDRGTLLFRQPISALDLNPLGVTLVQRIVATYQVDDPNNRGSVYAGRVQYRPEGDQGLLLGASVLTEDQGIQDFTLYGVDLLLPLGDVGRIVGEFARSSATINQMNAQGNAYRLEASASPVDWLAGQAYIRSTDIGFNNTASASFRPGQTRWGAELTGRISSSTQLRTGVDQERNVGTAPAVLTTAEALLQPGQTPIQGSAVDNTLTEYRAGVIQQLGTATLGVDYVNRSRTDRIGNQSINASQLASRFNLPITGTLNFLAQSELNLSNQADPLYPDRHTVGLEWALQPGVSLRLAQQFISGGQGPGSITSLDSLVNYDLDDNTTLTNRYSLLGANNGVTGQGSIGLNHRLVLAPGLRANFGFERIFGDAFNLTGAGQQFAQPYAVGSGASALGLQASTAYRVGLEYTDNPNWQASGRVEYRDSPGSSNLVLGAAAAGRFTDALTGLFRFDMANFANQTITDQLGNSSNLKLGLAYRNPHSDQLNSLLSYEFRNNPSTTPESLLFGAGSGSQDHTLSLETIYAPNWQWEFYGRYGLRHSTTRLTQSIIPSSTIHLAQFRANYRFAYRWDVGGEVRWIGQPVVGYNETGFALEAGYYLTPDVRLGLGYSFGQAHEGSFVGGGRHRSASGPYFGITAKVNQLFNSFGVQPIAPPQQQESAVPDRGQGEPTDSEPTDSEPTDSEPMDTEPTDAAPVESQPPERNADPEAASRSVRADFLELARATPHPAVMQDGRIVLGGEE
ncbi:TonB-dependent receptor [Phormidium sp. FACHB-1136]|uniref:TonB-dependent receptor n=1 Tax=Phormidium sp. FACHB-1136 TaxID=2692848 RepID=UPI001689B2DE|nr:TonB-dependent receptor [Phormidium sp. FACHB-1136]MBD2425741.1 TonB-dependent receptor [Phormidium sp. FACHB-1136]